MTKKCSLLQLVMTFTVVFQGVAIGISSLGFADEIPQQELALAQGNQSDPDSFRTSTGVTSLCRKCHNAAKIPSSNEIAAGGVDDFFKIDADSSDLTDDHWVLADEVLTWVTADKHSQAFFVLLNDRSKQMGDSLGIARIEGKSQIHRDKRCLACHTGLPIHEMILDESGLLVNSMVTDPRINFGVTCESCHGPSGDSKDGKLKGWYGPHVSKSFWRFKSPEKKLHKFGFNDVRSPVSKTKICLSCHLGNAKEGRVVTHEMYAAGHPPLPGFEIGTFVEQEPRHWREFSEKDKKICDEFIAKREDKDGYQPSGLSRTHGVLVGVFVGLSESLRLTGDLCQTDSVGPVETPDWPELAQFSCFACHHDLKSPAWRQKRRYTATPGRPVLHEWPSALVNVALISANISKADLKAKLEPVWKATDAQPFGRREELKQSCYAAADWIEGIAKKMEKQALTPDDGRKILTTICDIATSEMLDYDSARQLVFAFAICYGELMHPPNKANATERPEMSKPRVAPGWFITKQPADEIEKVLKSLDSIFLLDLQKGRRVQQLVPGSKTPRVTKIVDLSLVLPHAANYEPKNFQEKFKAISSLLKKK